MLLRSRTAVVLGALVAAAAVPAPSATADSHHPGDPRTWSSAQLAAQLVVGCVDVGDLGRARSWAAAGIGGVTLLGRASSAGALSDGLAAVRSAAPHGVTPFVSSDEEGGRVQRLAGAIWPLPAASTMGTWADDRIEQTAHDYGVQMRRLGVPMALSPVADLATPGHYIAATGRGFSPEPARVADAALAWSRGMQRAGVVPVVKHWPGHGSASDSHTTAPTVPPLPELEARDLVPFTAAFGAGAAIVMVGHLRSEGLTEPGLPATLSPSALRYLRERAGAAAVLVTDSLQMAASSSALGLRPEQAAVRALQAGADWALTCVADPLATVDAIRGALDDGSIPRAQAERSVRRVLALKQRSGLLAVPLVPLPPTGALDAIRTEPGWLRVQGWALDPDTSAPTPVRVHVDGGVVREVVAAGPRPDVARAHPGYGELHGFDVALPVAAGAREVCVEAASLTGGPSALLGCRTLDVAPPTVVPLPDSCPEPGLPAFDDVPADAWFAAHLDCGYGHGLVRGTAPRTYDPAGAVTRGQAASFVSRLLAWTGLAPDSPPDAFVDDDGSVHEPAIDALAAVGVVTGRVPGVFDPQASVTRAQAAALLVRLNELVTGVLPAVDPGFEDVEGVHAAAIGKAVGAQLAGGTTPWTFGPSSPVRRDQLVVLLVRTLGSIEQRR